MRNILNLKIHVYIVNLCLLVIFSVIFNKFLFVLVKTELLAVPVLIMEWILFGLLLLQLWRYKGYLLIKILLIVFLLKIVYYSLVLGEYNFQKGVIITELLTIHVFGSEQLRKYSAQLMSRYYNKLLILLVVSFVPFLPFYNRYYQEVHVTSFYDTYRFSGLWDLPHAFGYILLAVMILHKKDNILLNILLFSCLLLTGVRSTAIAGFVYMLYLLFFGKSRITKLKSQAFVVIILFALFFSANRAITFISQEYNYHISPLLEVSISDPTYGKGRVLMNISVIDEMKKFGFIELSIGKSATSLYNYYEKLIGIKSWPHNDFVTVLYLYGFIGLAFYIYTTILIPLKRIRFNFKSKVFITLVLAFILAFTNGFYTYSGMYLFILAYGVFYQEERDDMESRK